MIDRSMGSLRVSEIDTREDSPRLCGRQSDHREGHGSWTADAAKSDLAGIDEFARRPPPRRKEKDDGEAHWRSALQNATATARRSIRDCSRVSSAPFRNTEMVSAGSRNENHKTTQRKTEENSTHGCVRKKHEEKKK